jgi:hypothetical protein
VLSTVGLWSLDGIGDLNGDGIREVVFGTSMFLIPNTFLPAGAVTVFSGLNGTVIWQRQSYQPQSVYGSEIAAIGDVNGDAKPDVAISRVGGPNTQTMMIESLSGQDGSTIRTIIPTPTPSIAAPWFRPIRDLDGNGADDLLVAVGPMTGPTGTANAVQVFSSSTGAVLRTWFGQSLNDGFSGSFDGGGDVDGDGTPDAVIASPLVNGNTGLIQVFSGATGAVIHSIPGTAPSPGCCGLGRVVRFIDDADGDARPDILAQVGPSALQTYRVFSGATGVLLSSLLFTGPVYGTNAIEAAGDVNQDGLGDVILGTIEPVGGNTITGITSRVYSIAPLPPAAAITLGTPCGGAPGPSLLLQPPILGTMPWLGVVTAAASAAGALFAAPAGASAIPIGGGCVLHLDPYAAFAVLPFQTDTAGIWAVTIGLPPSAYLAGLNFTLQAGVAGGLTGLQITNGLDVHLGY